MGPLLLTLIVAMVSGFEKKDFEPLVAFVCNKGAMHMDPDRGWSSDPLTDCMESKEDILKYCKKTYPTLAVTNIVEHSEYLSVPGWCAFGSSCDSTESFKVRPYRCLTGPFQSDALVVPRKCLFDHVHKTDQCQSYDWWAAVAKKSCQDQNSMVLESYAMLLPCGTDIFTGVEFVCCPADALAKTTTSPEKVALPKIDVKVNAGSATASDDDVVDKYMRLTSQVYTEQEHEAYALAKKQLSKVSHDKVAKLMKDWEAARNRVIELNKIDSKGAEKLNTEITGRFQKEYFAMQTLSDAKTLQLDAVHQQHVQTKFNTKKRAAIEKLMEEMQSKLNDPEILEKYLERYISIEQKDAHHCLQHYLKIRSHDVEAGQQMLPATVEHLRLISTRINQSLDLLKQLSDRDAAQKVATNTRLWMKKSFADLDKTIRQLSIILDQQQVTTAPELPISKPLPVTSALPVSKPAVLAASIVPLDPVESDEDDPVLDKTPAKPKNDNLYKTYAEKLAKTDFVKKGDPVQTYKLAADSAKLGVVVHTELAKPQVNHISSGVLAVQDQSVYLSPNVSPGLSAGAAVAIAVGTLLSCIVIVVAILVVKRRGTRRPPTNTYLEVAVESPDITPEDRHIVAMQHGYENPTYKFLEQKKL